jgi:hypothetical protein
MTTITSRGFICRILPGVFLLTEPAIPVLLRENLRAPMDEVAER